MSGRVRIVHNKLLGGWYVVRGAHDTPLGGKFPSRRAANEWLERRAAGRGLRAGYVENYDYGRSDPGRERFGSDHGY